MNTDEHGTRRLLLLVALFVVSLPAVTSRLYSSDEVEYFSYLRSLWFDHDVSFENEYQYFYDHHIAQLRHHWLRHPVVSVLRGRGCRRSRQASRRRRG